MKCFYHSDRDATKFCNNCGKPLCDECVRSVKGVIYCEDCLNLAISSQKKLKSIEDSSPNPGIALLLSFFPGLGAVYNGEYMKAIFQFLIFWSLILLSGWSGVFIFGVGAALYYFYTIFDAYKSANEIRLKGGIREKESKYAGIYRGIFLMAIGVLFLLNNFGLLSFRFMKVYWPILLILLGGYLIYFDYFKKKDRKEELKNLEEKNEQ